MKKIIFTLALVLISLTSFAQEKQGVTITVTIDNVKNDTGKVLLSLHTSETFMKGKGIQDVETDINNGKISVTFENVLPGNYAVMALHDENLNQRMDYRENGMPLESYGTSNNVMAFGPPVYDDAKFKVEGKDVELRIRF